MARVLVVDDYPVNVELLERCLSGLGYEVEGAEGGRQALSAIAERMPDIVLMDVLMPGFSGLDVLRAVRAEARTADLPVILVSGRGDSSDIVEGLALGANDYVTKPIDMPILQARLATQAALKRAQDELKRTARRLREELQRKAEELKTAGQVQRSILPPREMALSGLRVAWSYEPATEVGGDLLDVIPLSGGRTFLFVADAMGHGVQAALVASTVKATLAAYLAEADDLPRLLGRLDRSLEDLFDDRFVTAAACVVDPRAGTLRYALAGHPPILLAGPEGVTSLSAGGLPLGTALGWQFQGGECLLPPKASLLIFTDGLTECEGPDGRLLGIDSVAGRLAWMAGEGPEAIVDDLRNGLRQFRRGLATTDDVTILAACLDVANSQSGSP